MSAAQSKHLFPYTWRLADGFPANGITENGLKVFGTFVCGGGSAMGYKLAGFDYLGGVEIDKAIGEIYCRNLHPKYFYNEDIRDFLRRDDLPAELYNLDILDGSPPCTLFSLNRGRKGEEAWGKPKTFNEGQAEQTLDDLVLVWCDLVAKLQPKVALMENVEGLIKGGAKKYYMAIVRKLNLSGYAVQGFVLDAMKMGVPQTRRRVFIIARRKDLNLPPVDLTFDEPVIPFGEFRENSDMMDLGEVSLDRWKHRRKGDKNMDDVAQRIHGVVSDFSTYFIYDHLPCPTLTTAPGVCFEQPRHTTERERERAATFPIDYDYMGGSLNFLTGMCVPPVMTAQISHQIAVQLFNK